MLFLGGGVSRDSGRRRRCEDISVCFLLFERPARLAVTSRNREGKVQKNLKCSNIEENVLHTDNDLMGIVQARLTVSLAHLDCQHGGIVLLPQKTRRFC